MDRPDSSSQPLTFDTISGLDMESQRIAQFFTYESQKDWWGAAHPGREVPEDLPDQYHLALRSHLSAIPPLVKAIAHQGITAHLSDLVRRARNELFLPVIQEVVRVGWLEGLSTLLKSFTSTQVSVQVELLRAALDLSPVLAYPAALKGLSLGARELQTVAEAVMLAAAQKDELIRFCEAVRCQETLPEAIATERLPLMLINDLPFGHALRIVRRLVDERPSAARALMPRLERITSADEITNVQRATLLLAAMLGAGETPAARQRQAVNKAGAEERRELFDVLGPTALPYVVDGLNPEAKRLLPLTLDYLLNHGAAVVPHLAGPLLNVVMDAPATSALRALRLVLPLRTADEIVANNLFDRLATHLRVSPEGERLAFWRILLTHPAGTGFLAAPLTWTIAEDLGHLIDRDESIRPNVRKGLLSGLDGPGLLETPRINLLLRLVELESADRKDEALLRLGPAIVAHLIFAADNVVNALLQSIGPRLESALATEIGRILPSLPPARRTLITGAVEVGQGVLRAGLEASLEGAEALLDPIANRDETDPGVAAIIAATADPSGFLSGRLAVRLEEVRSALTQLRLNLLDDEAKGRQAVESGIEPLITAITEGVAPVYQASDEDFLKALDESLEDLVGALDALAGAPPPALAHIPAPVEDRWADLRALRQTRRLLEGHASGAFLSQLAQGIAPCLRRLDLLMDNWAGGEAVRQALFDWLRPWELGPVGAVGSRVQFQPDAHEWGGDGDPPSWVKVLTAGLVGAGGYVYARAVVAQGEEERK